MNSAGIRSENSPRGTLAVTAELLRRYLPGDLRRIVTGLLLLLGASGVGLLQPWPLKLVLDSVLGDAPAPRFITRCLDLLLPHDYLATHPQIALLAALCGALL